MPKRQYPVSPHCMTVSRNTLDFSNPAPWPTKKNPNGTLGFSLWISKELIPGTVSHLQYANDTILLIENDIKSITNLKIMLICFELLSGLKINLSKSEVIVMGVPTSEQARVPNLI